MRHRVNRLQLPPHRSAFSLIEILVVIGIIGILMALLVPAAQGVIRRSKVTSIKVTLTQLEQAIEDYRNKYGDYPPDFSDWALTQRHFRKAFPKISSTDLALMKLATHDASGTFTGVLVDRSEALVFVLGGFSDDPVHPFTGPGGPLELIDPSAPGLLGSYQYNASRSNALYEFPSDDLTLSSVDASAAVSATNKYASNDESRFATGASGDIFPAFVQSGRNAPYLYFDHRTYGILPAFGVGNGYASSVTGNIRPYKSEKAVLNTGGGYASVTAAVNAYEFVNPKSFQIISAGLDDTFGEVVGGISTTGPPPTYFMYRTGAYFVPDTNASAPAAMVSGSRYQETSIVNPLSGLRPAFNSHMDNITNFSRGELADELP